MIEILLGVIAVAIFIYYVLPALLVLLVLFGGAILVGVAIVYDWMKSLRW